jgi:hypothetical protein
VVGVEFSLLFLALPVGAWCVGASVVASNYSDLRDKGLPAVKVGSTGGRLLIYCVLTATHAVFGLVLWLQVASIEERYGALVGNARSALVWVGVAFAWAAVLAIVSQASTTRLRLSQFVGEGFGRALILIVIWNNLTIFGMVVALLALGRISTLLRAASDLTAGQTHQITLAALGFALGACGALIGVVWSAKVRDLSTVKDFVRALKLTDIGIAPLLIGLLWAILTLGAM